MKEPRLLADLPLLQKVPLPVGCHVSQRWRARNVQRLSSPVNSGGLDVDNRCCSEWDETIPNTDSSHQTPRNLLSKTDQSLGELKSKVHDQPRKSEEIYQAF